MKKAIPLKFGLVLLLFAGFVLVFSSDISAQDETDPVVRLEKLRLDLIELQTKEAELQARAQQLDEDLKPENIERALAGFGSTRPEELRENRRRQLQIERDSLQAQLNLLAKMRTDLESAILNAETQAYQQSAKGNKAFGLDQMIGTQFAAAPLWLLVTLVALLSILGLTVWLLIIRRMKAAEVRSEVSSERRNFPNSD